MGCGAADRWICALLFIQFKYSMAFLNVEFLFIEGWAELRGQMKGGNWQQMLSSGFLQSFGFILETRAGKAECGLIVLIYPSLC